MHSPTTVLAISTFFLGALASESKAANPHLVEYPSFLNVLPEPFDRPNFITSLFYQTTLPSDAPPKFAAAYAQLQNASFVSFDPRFASEFVGPTAGPIQKVPNASAGTIHKGQIYMGNNGDTSVHGGIWMLDYKTGNATMILNNQLGLSLGVNDMTADKRGGLFFTDPSSRVPSTNRSMQSPPSLYYLRLNTMSLIDVDPTLAGPNGVAISPDGTELYVGDNGDYYDPPNDVLAQVLTAGKGSSELYINSAGPRTIYAYALSPITGLPTARRTLAVVESGFTDGIRVSSSGHILVALFGGVDVYHPDGTRLGRINIPEASANGAFVERHVVNMAFEGNTLWCFATGGLYRVPGLLVGGDPRLS
ncbi:hypothetical protein B0H17DRAFT_1042875 [Mycena rosella]|uniref:SMP-30/Gluconolactonase/LRE-like region domain-containing protein n=1 Tax=Mycena rosella TaxID=1033263 RepID=A0AAD7DYH9_MYCRO|nr:hypothetical protein B0H17DRAFT_1042875 [Mycena rosella]